MSRVAPGLYSVNEFRFWELGVSSVGRRETERDTGVNYITAYMLYNFPHIDLAQGSKLGVIQIPVKCGENVNVVLSSHAPAGIYFSI